ncbi:MAG: hypothetical protein CVV64_02915 [Candidatus Wallbacteria bacterium HGW-Wallbacteria-1]|jgi:hypothetical protein|uniref:Uncharacterized protein n=1 Tax=Candidatus Wallbacteria bacterium HGW-Wallbacteria-1 TaxID=2013854 RepID=A0A2N1PTG3_9BACT|nr:MAG: hypothetical protein CVV64_02915 [Candidatus Wallbacteria bacterium HGW-Wallbacteria-1]
MKNLRQLHFCKDEGALGTFDTASCDSCPYREPGRNKCRTSSSESGKSGKGFNLLVPIVFLALAMAAGKPEITMESMGIAWKSLLEILSIDIVQAGFISKILSGAMAMAAFMSAVRCFSISMTSEEAYQGYLRCGN